MVVFQVIRRSLLSVGIAGLVASTLRAVGFGATARIETDGWRDLTSDELLSSSLLTSTTPDLVDLTSQTIEAV